MKARRAQFLAALLMTCGAAISWGFWSLFLRPSGLPAAITGPLMLLVMGLTLLPAIALSRERPAWDRTAIALLLGLSVADAVNVAAFFAAMDATTLGVSVLSHYLAPLLVALAAPALSGERVPGARAAALVAVLGLAMVLEPWRGSGDGRMLGAALGALSAVGYAGNIFCAARLVPRVGAARSVGLHALVSALLLAPFVTDAAWESVTPRGAGLVALGAVTLGAVSGWLFSRGIPVVGPTLASTAALLEPLVAVLVGSLWWDERLSPAAALGALLVLGSGAWVTRARARSAGAEEPVAGAE